LRGKRDVQSDFLRLEGELKRGILHPVYLLYGQEDHLRERAVRLIVEATLPPEERALNLLSLSAEESTLEEILELCSSLPLMGKGKVVLIRGRETPPFFKSPLFLQYLQDPSPSTVLILSVQGDLTTVSSGLKEEWRYSFPSVRERDLLPWIQRMASEKGIEISREAAQMMRELVGADLGSVEKELEKLSLYVEGGRIEEEDVLEMVGAMRVPSVFELASSLAERDLRGAIKASGRLWESGELPSRILGAMAWYFRKLLFLKEILSTGKEGTERREMVSLARRVPKERLEEALLRLYEADLHLKSTSLPPRVILERLIVSLCG